MATVVSTVIFVMVGSYLTSRLQVVVVLHIIW